MNDNFGTIASQGRKARTGHFGAGRGGNSMTRQEQKAVKELSEMISKNLKVIAREHGFKVVSDCAYKVLGDFLYEVFLSAPPVRRGTAIRAVVSTKPCVIDNVFWDVYEMGEVARKKPFSFHITAAHSPSAHIIKEMELPVPTVNAATLVMNEAFCRFNKSIQDHHSRCSTVSDFKAEILHDTAPAARLNVVLCEIAEGNFRQAMLLAEKELENEPYGLFNTVTDGGIKSIYDYVKEFCQKKQ
ncbi:hypothetical protein [Oscillibacter valericigenes]|uniref:hypothetical protein n=1 Tax=Oscillibacter valericigenes TaxID=351091 RepID=UPI001958CCCF|nr:hypothetical protein [Oscillibacter valericigenes]MBM6911264.1 hypothetical protein [Oscillibacter valericigenes]